MLLKTTNKCLGKVRLYLILILNFHQTIQRFTYKYRKNNCRLRMFRLHKGPDVDRSVQRIRERHNCTVRSGKPVTSMGEYNQYSGLLLWPPSYVKVIKLRGSQSETKLLGKGNRASINKLCLSYRHYNFQIRYEQINVNISRPKMNQSYVLT